MELSSVISLASVSRQNGTLYEDYDVRSEYDDPSTYGVRNSYYGKGKYPPDWHNRREAVWAEQKYQCGRCATYKGDASVSEVHHVRHLSNGGSNHLDNLVGLCGDCHALMHPDVDEMAGSRARAELFPAEYAEDQVAVIRKPNGDDALARDLSRVEAFSTPDVNRYAVTSASVATSANTARRSVSKLQSMLVEKGYVPRTTAYHRVRFVPIFTGRRGIFTSYRPELTHADDAEASEMEWYTGNEYCDFFYTQDASKTTIEGVDGVDAAFRDELRLPADEDGARIRLEMPVEPPKLHLRTAPRYALDASKYFGWESFKWGIVPALVLTLLLPSFLPFETSLASVLGLSLIIGLALRVPKMSREFGRSPEKRIIDEKASDSA